MMVGVELGPGIARVGPRHPLVKVGLASEYYFCERIYSPIPTTALAARIRNTDCTK